MASVNAHEAVTSLFQSLGLPQELPDNYLHLTGDPQVALPSSFNLGVAAQASIAASGLSAALLYAQSGGEKQRVTVNARHAALEFHSEAYYAINESLPGDVWDDLAGMYPTKDASFVRIHTNFPHHRDGILSILGLPSITSREAVAEALSLWDSKDFEADRGTKSEPPVQLLKIADAPRRAPTSPLVADHALSGIRVLDLTRVLAGPICGRTLAAHGADVLLITSPKLPSLPPLDADTSRGKRTTQLDLTTPADREQLWSLVRESDVFLQAYRPGGLADKGFNVDEAEAFAAFKGEPTGPGVPIMPRPFPLQALDHAAGYMLAFGVNAALWKTMTEGGSWEVRVSLAGVGNWVRSLGRLGPDGFKNVLPQRLYPPAEEIATFSTELRIAHAQRAEGRGQGDSVSSRGRMLALRHSAILEKTPVVERVARARLDADLPRWLPLY